MAVVIATTNQYGDPQCPMCLEPVDFEGQFCSPDHWLEFHQTIHEMGEPIVEMDYLPLEKQAWYGRHHG